MTTPPETSPPFTIPALLFRPDSQPRRDLLTQTRLLHLIHHRSKNQHRRSIWYRHFNTFRREVTRLCLDLEIDLGPGFPTPSTSQPAPTASKAGASTSKPKSIAKLTGGAKPQPKQPTPPAINKATTRITHLLTTSLIPSCYQAFISLTATPSFAPLALTLLAILARVCSVTGITGYFQAVASVVEEREKEGVEEAMGELLGRFAEEDAGELFGRLDTPGGGDGNGRAEGCEGDDVGVAVERDLVKQDTAMDMGEGAGGEMPVRAKKRRKKGNAIDDLFAGL